MAINVVDVKEADFERLVIERSHTMPVVVDFWAEWCQPCRVLGPILERLAAQAGDTWTLAKVDTEKNPSLQALFKIQSIPTVIAFRDGVPVSAFSGAIPEVQVQAFLNGVVPSEQDLGVRAAETAWEAGDIAAAEAGFRAVLAADPAHQDAGLGLAGILLEREDAQGAIEVLGQLAPSEDVKRLLAVARLGPTVDLESAEAAAKTGGAAEKLVYARALAASGDHRHALQTLMDLIADSEPTAVEDARMAMLDLFALLGPSDPLTVEFRRRLASAIF